MLGGSSWCIRETIIAFPWDTSFQFPILLQVTILEYALGRYLSWKREAERDDERKRLVVHTFHCFPVEGFQARVSPITSQPVCNRFEHHAVHLDWKKRFRAATGFVKSNLYLVPIFPLCPLVSCRFRFSKSPIASIFRHMFHMTSFVNATVLMRK